MITGKLYDWLKWIAQVILPALGTLYLGVDAAVGLGSASEVVGTIVVVDTFLGTILGISQVNFNKNVVQAGEVIIDEDGKKHFQLDGDNPDIDDIENKAEVRFTVKKSSPE